MSATYIEQSLAILVLQTSALSLRAATGDSCVVMFVSYDLAQLLPRDLRKQCGKQMQVDCALPGVACYSRVGY